MDKRTRSLKTAISVPEAVFHQAEEAAKRLGLNRSQLYTQALTEFLAQRSDSGITERLDAIYACEDAKLDVGLKAMQAASLPREDW